VAWSRISTTGTPPSLIQQLCLLAVLPKSAGKQHFLNTSKLEFFALFFAFIISFAIFV
jgi:hypothetical protein